MRQLGIGRERRAIASATAGATGQHATCAAAGTDALAGTMTRLTQGVGTASLWSAQLKRTLVS